MLKIRFQRVGRVNDPAFRVVVLEHTASTKAGTNVAVVGSHNPRTKHTILDAQAIKGWIGKGAQPTGTVHNLLVTKGIIEGKKVNVLQKKNIKKTEEPVAPAPEAPAETTTEEPKPEEPAA